MDKGIPTGIWGIKGKITSQPVLSLPKRESKFRIEKGALEYVIRGVLSQE